MFKRELALFVRLLAVTLLTTLFVAVAALVIVHL